VHPEDPDNPNRPEDPTKAPPRVSRWAIIRSVVNTLLTLVILGGITTGLLAVFHPDTPLPDGWNPTTPLAVTEPVTPLTSWKMRMALADPEQCVSVLNAVANAPRITPIEVSENCHVRNRVSLSSFGAARIDPIETSCATALRMAMWEHHGVQPAAREILGAEASVFRQVPQPRA